MHWTSLRLHYSNSFFMCLCDEFLFYVTFSGSVLKIFKRLFVIVYEAAESSVTDSKSNLVRI